MYTPFSEVIFDLHTLCNRYYVVCLKLYFTYRGENIVAHNLFYDFHGVGMTQSDELVIINSLKTTFETASCIVIIIKLKTMQMCNHNL